MDSIRFNNYRCFVDTGDVKIKPLTFLLGANSSGKSSFLEFFPLLKQSVGIRRNGVFLWYANDVDFKDFGNAVRSGADSMTISWQYDDFIVNISRDRNRLKKLFSEESFIPKQVPLRLTMTLSSRKKDNYDRLARLIIEFLDVEIILKINDDGIVSAVINGREFKNEKVVIRVNDSTFLLPRLFLIFKEDGSHYSSSYYRLLDQDELFSKEEMKELKEMMMMGDMIYLKKGDYLTFFQKIIRNSTVDLEYLRDYYLLIGLEELIERINFRIQAEASNMSYVKPLRVMPERYYRFQNYSVDEIDSDGKNLSMFLANLSSEEMRKFQKWTNINFGFKIYVSKHEGHVELTIGSSLKTARNLVDVGFGYTQLLPIITIIWNAMRSKGRDYYYPRIGKPETIIAIEQPELHLHPKIQAMFAECLAKVIVNLEASKSVRFIVETHSEAIINRIGAMIQSAELDRNDVNVVLLNAFGEDSHEPVVEAEFDKNGYLSKWPLGFFSS